MSMPYLQYLPSSRRENTAILHFQPFSLIFPGVESLSVIFPGDGEADAGPGAGRRAVPQPLQGQGARPQG